MTQLAAGQPFYENIWLAAGSIVLLSIILGAMLTLLIMIIVLMTRLTTRLIAPWIQEPVENYRWIAIALSLISLISLSVLIGSLGSLSDVSRTAATGNEPISQAVLQQRLAQDEQALDRGVLTYPALPTLKTNLPTTLTVIVTDLGKHPDGSMTAEVYSHLTGMVVYPKNVPTGGIVSLRLTCTTNFYCQALSSNKQAIVGVRTVGHGVGT